MKWTAVLMMLLMIGAPAFPQVERTVLYHPGKEEFSHLAKTANYTQVSYELVKGMMLVKAEIEGRRGNFILDTGAPSLIVNGDNLNGKEEEWSNVSGDYTAQTIRIKQFNWAGIQKNEIEAIALDISHLEEVYQRELLGVIGYQVFAGHEILVNASTMQIIIFDGKKNYLSRIGKPLTTLPFDMQGHLPVIRAKVGNENYLFGFDSGCTANLLDQEVLDKLPEGSYSILAQRELHGFSKEPQDVVVVSTSTIELENFPSENTEYLVTSFSHLKEAGAQISGLLGYPFFKNLTFSINYASRQLSIWQVHNAEAELMP